jgi:tetratricopeptide (TPR) repeat protein
MTIKKYIVILLFLPILFGSCKKYLDEKTNKRYIIPESLSDLQALLDYYPKMNNADSYAAEVSADDYYVTTDDYYSYLPREEQRIYSWAKDSIFDASSSTNGWSDSYKSVYVANTVLEKIDILNEPANSDWQNIKGQALFFRAKAFHQLAITWAKVYNPTSAATDLGIPLRLSSDFNQKSVRATLQETFNRIVKDLTDAVPLLPNKAVSAMRPSKVAAYAMLARVYLYMGDYDKALSNAQSALSLQNTLIDYNTLDTTSDLPIQPMNAEVIFSSSMVYPNALYFGKGDSLVIKSFAANDLRKSIFFKDNGDKTFMFKGSYDNSSFFTGLATDEIILIQAECFARKGNASQAMTDLNTLLEKRWKTGTFIPLVAANADQAITIILNERRKELLYRGIRWSDLKRLNMAGANINIQRKIDNTLITLKPNDLKYALAIPEDVISLSGMPQNPR